MRICYLAPASSAHTIKWCDYMTRFGHDCHVVSLVSGAIQHASVHVLENKTKPDSNDLTKLGYLTKIREAKRIVESLGADVIHAHYATSYGLLATLAVKRPYWLSVWGADVYEFPNKSPLHRAALKRSLSHAAGLMSTSRVMAYEASKYTTKEFHITPFGVDTQLFSPSKRTRPIDDGRFVVGTVKALTPKYGIHTMLRGIALARSARPDIPWEVRIAGKGPQEQSLRALAFDLGLGDMVTWLGFISQEQAAVEWANMDVAVIVSENESESFGVSAVEAQSSGTALIISDIPGLMEACGNGESGVCVPRGDEEAVAQALVRLYDDQQWCQALAQRGRKLVKERFEASACFREIEHLYQTQLDRTNRTM